jgi:hypothetical protein
VSLCCHRANTRAATTVRNRERLVQVQVRNVATQVTKACEAQQCVEVCTINVNLAASGVHRFVDLEHIFFVNAVRRRVRDHEGCERICVLGDLRA